MPTVFLSAQSMFFCVCSKEKREGSLDIHHLLQVGHKRRLKEINFVWVYSFFSVESMALCLLKCISFFILEASSLSWQSPGQKRQLRFKRWLWCNLAYGQPSNNEIINNIIHNGISIFSKFFTKHKKTTPQEDDLGRKIIFFKKLHFRKVTILITNRTDKALLLTNLFKLTLSRELYSLMVRKVHNLTFLSFSFQAEQYQKKNRKMLVILILFIIVIVLIIILFGTKF